MANQFSAKQVLQSTALTKGPGRGLHAPDSAANVRMYSDVADLAVGTIASATEAIRFMKIPAGAVIYRSMGSLISTNHTATVAGKLRAVPLDGSAAVDIITGVTALLEATETTSIPDVGDDVKIAKDSWIEFVPTSDLVIASTVKKMWLRLMYGQTY